MTVWSDAGSIADTVFDELQTFHWAVVEALVQNLISRIRSTAEPFPERVARRLIRDLRRKRKFELMASLAEALLLSGTERPQIRRQFAQGLIDSGQFAAADAVLQQLLSGLGSSEPEHAEAFGLRGRLYKQWYLNAGRDLPTANPGYLLKAIDHYNAAWQVDKQSHYWHGVNVCALLARAHRHGITIPGATDYLAVAHEVQASLNRLEEGGTGPLPAFGVATAVEIRVAFGDFEGAVAKAGEYIRCEDADEFEVASTLRQLKEVWELTASTPPGATLLPVLHSALLRGEGGDMSLTVAQARSDSAAIGTITHASALQAVLGDSGFQNLMWYKLGLERCASIARIETRSGAPFGTGWLVRGSDLRPDWGNDLLLVTNKHVLSPTVNGQRCPIPGTTGYAQLPGESVANFQVLSKRVPIHAEAVWSSQDFTLDATVVRLSEVPVGALPLELERVPVTVKQPPSRVYLIGHPGRRDLEFSLLDNVMIDCNERVVHYRAPTESGSSGSPVFEDKNWLVIALHHAGGTNTPKLNGQGFYSANEGVLIQSIRAAMSQV